MVWLLGDREVIEGLYRRFLEVHGRVREELNEVLKLLEKERLDRGRLARVLVYLRSDLKVLVELVDSIDNYIGQLSNMRYKEVLNRLPLPLAVVLAFLIAYSEQAKMLKYKFEQYISSLKSAADSLLRRFSSGTYLFSDAMIRKELYDIVSSILEDLKVLDVRVESSLYKMGYSVKKHYSMTAVIDLITFHVNDWPGLNDRWVCAATYLASLEVSVNKACSELGIKAEHFKEKLDKLVQYMRRKGVEVSRIEKDIVARLYDYRNRVLHGGYIPTDAELQYIVEVVPKFIKAMKGFRGKP